MEKLSIVQLEEISGGGKGIDGFCAGLGAAAAAYQVGIWANLWNPAGQGALVFVGVVGIGCAFYSIR